MNITPYTSVAQPSAPLQAAPAPATPPAQSAAPAPAPAASVEISSAGRQAAGLQVVWGDAETKGDPH